MVFDMYNITFCMCSWREVRNFLSQKFRSTPGCASASPAAHFLCSTARIR